MTMTDYWNERARTYRQHGRHGDAEHAETIADLFRIIETVTA